ncbi:Fibroblast growth factor 3 [Ranunculus cassubicifolius]
MFVLSRVVLGIGFGGILLASPIYLAEISPCGVRGALVSTFYLFVSGGQFLAYLMSKTLSSVPGTGTYRLMLVLEGFLAIAQFNLMNTLPESPPKLHRQDREKAVILLNYLYSPHEAEKEIETLESSLNGVKLETFFLTSDILETLSRNISMSRGYVAGIGCMIAQQLVGINFVMYYAPKLLKLDSIVLPGLSILGCLSNICFVDTWGRRKVLLISIIGMAVSLWMLSHGLKEHTQVLDYDFLHNISFTRLLSPPNLESYMKANVTLHMNSSTAYSGAMVRIGFLVEGKGSSNQGTSFHEKADIFAWSGLYSYIIFYSFGMGTVPWIINSEIYPYNHRVCFAALVSLWSIYSNFFVGFCMWFIFEALGPSNTFALLSVVTLATSLFVFLLVPETKGVRIEEIESMMSAGKNKKETC